MVSTAVGDGRLAACARTVAAFLRDIALGDRLSRGTITPYAVCLLELRGRAGGFEKWLMGARRPDLPLAGPFDAAGYQRQLKQGVRPKCKYELRCC